MSSTEQATIAEQWRDTLLKALATRQPELARFEDYYNGNHRLLFAQVKFRETFGTLFGGFSDNWVDLVVDASAERLKVEGFRFGAEGQEEGDTASWELWQRNYLDAESELAHTEAIKLGCAYALVGPDDAGEPSIQLESPANAIVAIDPASGRHRLAGLRDWLDEWGAEQCTLYLPDAVMSWRREGNSKSWEALDELNGVNPLGAVPLVPLPNMPTLRNRQGRSDVERVIPVQDAVNKLCADMLVASEYAAFPQRWMTGVDIPRYPEGDPNAGEMLPSFAAQFRAGAGQVWAVSEATAAFGAFQVSDLTNYVRAIEMLIQHVAAQTRTPPHYLLGSSGSFPSGESLKATETGLVNKVKRKQVAFGEGWEEVMRLAFAVAGDQEKATAWDLETIWANPESRSTAETVDAAVKLSSIGVPRPALWEYIGATPQQIQRWIAEGAETEGPAVVARETITATPAEAAAQLPTAPVTSATTNGGSSA